MKPRTLVTALLALPLLVGCGPTAKPDSSGEEPGSVDRMAAEHEGDRPDATPAAKVDPAGEVEAGPVEYHEVDGDPVRGFLARPADGATVRGGVLVLHEWWGLNDNIEQMARRLAGEGYAALAVDLYGGESADEPEGARKLAREAAEDPDAIRANLAAARTRLAEEPGVLRIATLGWCFGGGWSLRAALWMPEEIDAAILYYGRPVLDPDELEALEAPLLGIFAAEDDGIPVDAVEEFRGLLDELGKDATIHVVPGVDHAFANPSGQRYDAEAAEDAWEKTLAFLDEHLDG